jgi:hypothetical protein
MYPRGHINLPRIAVNLIKSPSPQGANGEIKMITYDVAAFCELAGILPDSPMGAAIVALSEEEFRELESVVDADEDYLIHVDPEGFTVNHGNVGSSGIRYDF